MASLKFLQRLPDLRQQGSSVKRFEDISTDADLFRWRVIVIIGREHDDASRIDYSMRTI